MYSLAKSEQLEARAGIEPAYTDLQSAASPFRHRASSGAGGLWGQWRRVSRWSGRDDEAALSLCLGGRAYLIGFPATGHWASLQPRDTTCRHQLRLIAAERRD